MTDTFGVEISHILWSKKMLSLKADAVDEYVQKEGPAFFLELPAGAAFLIK